MNNNRNASVQDFVVPADHQVINWQDVLVLAVVENGNFIPISLQTLVGGQRVMRWQRDFHKNSVPYLVMVGDQMVIGFVYKGRLVKAIALKHLRDLPEGHKPPMDVVIEVKRATATAMDLPVAFDGIEQAFVDGINAAQKAGQIPQPAPAKNEPTPLVLRDVSASPPVAEPAAPVKAPQTALAGAIESADARQKALAEHTPITVYSADTDPKSEHPFGSELAGIPVQQRDLKFVVPGTAYVIVTKTKKPTHFFIAIAKTDGAPYDARIEVTAEMQVHHHSAPTGEETRIH